MSIKKSSKESKFIKFAKAPIKFLIMARDFYVKSLTECSNQVAYASVVGYPASQVNTAMPRSFSVNSAKSSSNDEDYRELVRAASTKSLRNKIEQDLRNPPARKPPSGYPTGRNNMPRSYSVGIGRIDEEESCDFEDGVKVKVDVFPRSRSHAVSKVTTGLL